MKKHKEILRLHYECGWPVRRIAEVSKASVGTVHNVLTQARRARLGWPLPEDMDEAQLEQVLYPCRPEAETDDAQVDFAWVRSQLRLKSVTRKLVWMELCEQRGYAHSYGWFCRCYNAWAKEGKRSMRIRHVPGDMVFVDFSGLTAAVGERRAEIFVAALGVSHYTFACAVWSQRLEDWLECNTRMLEFFGGVPNLICPDNLKAAVTRACRYDPDGNGTYQQWAEHYSVAVMPTRPNRPKDKSVVENAVQQVQRWVLAPLRNHRFESLSQLNREMSGLLHELNHRNFSDRPGSRAQVFETADRPALRPLPLLRFEATDHKSAKVGFDYHVHYRKAWYSVPHELVGKTVDIRARAGLVSIFHQDRQVCQHVRLTRYGYSTQDSHMPPAHDFMQKWTPERISGWARDVGEHCAMWIEQRLTEAQHFQQVSRQALGLLSLQREHGKVRLDAACRIANRSGLRRLGQIREILKNETDLRAEPELNLQLPQDHENLRGARHFK